MTIVTASLPDASPAPAPPEPAPAPPDAVLAPETGALRVDSDPEGADVTIDGTLVLDRREPAPGHPHHAHARTGCPDLATSRPAASTRAARDRKAEPYR